MKWENAGCMQGSYLLKLNGELALWVY